jgi:hypothetical protein
MESGTMMSEITSGIISLLAQRTPKLLAQYHRNGWHNDLRLIQDDKGNLTYARYSVYQYQDANWDFQLYIGYEMVTETEKGQLLGNTLDMAGAFGAASGGSSGFLAQAPGAAGIIKSLKGAKGLIGHGYEDFLAKSIDGASGAFKAGGREFDGAYDGGKIWFEAKSGRYWEDIVSSEKGLAKFKSDMGDRLRIATENNATYELFSNTVIPNDVKEWLTKKGIKYTETLE